MYVKARKRGSQVILAIRDTAKFQFKLAIFFRASLFENEMVCLPNFVPPIEKKISHLQTDSERNNIRIVWKEIGLKLVLFNDSSEYSKASFGQYV